MEYTYPHDVRGWLQDIEAFALYHFASGKRALELGSYCGKSTICIAQSANEVYCVDPFVVEATTPSTDGEDVYQEFLDNVRRYGVFEKLQIGRFHTNKIQFPESLRFNFAFIDAAHDEGSVARDLEIVLRYLDKGSWLAFHDYCDDWPGVVKVVDAFRGKRAFKLYNELALVRYV